MNPLDFINITSIASVVMLIGAIGVIVLPKPLDKVIMFTLLQGGFIATVVAAKYLDVAMAASIFDPIVTIILLMAIIKLNETRQKRDPWREMNLIETQIWFYTGCILLVGGTLATVAGPGVKDPIIRTLNTEIPTIGLSLILLTYNHTLALLTFIAASAIITMILLRVIVRMEEMGAQL